LLRQRLLNKQEEDHAPGAGAMPLRRSLLAKLRGGLAAWGGFAKSGGMRVFAEAAEKFDNCCGFDRLGDSPRAAPAGHNEVAKTKAPRRSGALPLRLKLPC
jgi:hypothetical protein